MGVVFLHSRRDELAAVKKCAFRENPELAKEIIFTQSIFQALLSAFKDAHRGTATFALIGTVKRYDGIDEYCIARHIKEFRDRCGIESGAIVGRCAPERPRPNRWLDFFISSAHIAHKTAIGCTPIPAVLIAAAIGTPLSDITHHIPLVRIT